jgi:hypothetical protein
MEGEVQKIVIPLSEEFANLLLTGRDDAVEFNWLNEIPTEFTGLPPKSGDALVKGIAANSYESLPTKLKKSDKWYHFWVTSRGRGFKTFELMRKRWITSRETSMLPLESFEATIHAEWDAAGPRIEIDLNNPTPIVKAVVKKFVEEIKELDAKGKPSVEARMAEKPRIDAERKAATAFWDKMPTMPSLPNNVIRSFILPAKSARVIPNAATALAPLVKKGGKSRRRHLRRRQTRRKL